MNKYILLVVVSLALVQLCACIPSNNQVQTCLSNLCSSNCAGKYDEYACKIATNNYNNYLKQAECVRYLEKVNTSDKNDEFPLHLWNICRNICYNAMNTSPTMDLFLNCQDKCIQYD